MPDPRPQGRHAGLTRDQVVAAAVRVVDEDGASALTMRRVARELGVEAMSLYHHVRNKQGLEDAVVEHVLVEGLAGAARGGPWQQALAGYAERLHRALTAHPGAVILFATRPAVTPATATVLESLLRVLHEAGFAPGTALQMLHAGAGAVVGLHLATAGGEAVGAGAASLPPDGDSPLLAQAMADLPPTLDARLRLTLDALVAGFAALR